MRLTVRADDPRVFDHPSECYGMNFSADGVWWWWAVDLDTGICYQIADTMWASRDIVAEVRKNLPVRRASRSRKRGGPTQPARATKKPRRSPDGR